MNYSDDILENKTFNIVKSVLYNFALAVCILLAGCLLMVYAFNFKLDKILSGSQRPYINVGDIVVYHKQKEYKPGDILRFDNNGVNTVHRLIAVAKDSSGVKHYICHGDNTTNTDGSPARTHSYKWEIEQFKGMTYNQIKEKLNSQGTTSHVQDVTKDKILGKVVGVLTKSARLLENVKNHKVLFISIILSIWCVCSTIQSEQEFKKAFRLCR